MSTKRHMVTVQGRGKGVGVEWGGGGGEVEERWGQIGVDPPRAGCCSLSLPSSKALKRLAAMLLMVLPALPDLAPVPVPGATAGGVTWLLVLGPCNHDGDVKWCSYRMLILIAIMLICFGPCTTLTLQHELSTP